ncbi:MAG: hypothetical protein FWH27_10520, partial [Planctomycetaceae bacterium]|nr:hypothetical protein [Planctomycetaceae bacterium]
LRPLREILLFHTETQRHGGMINKKPKKPHIKTRDSENGFQFSSVSMFGSVFCEGGTLDGQAHRVQNDRIKKRMLVTKTQIPYFTGEINFTINKASDSGLALFAVYKS